MNPIKFAPKKPVFTWWLTAGLLALAVVAIPGMAQQAQDEQEKQTDGKEQQLEQIQKQLQELLKSVQQLQGAQNGKPHELLRDRLGKYQHAIVPPRRRRRCRAGQADFA